MKRGKKENERKTVTRRERNESRQLDLGAVATLVFVAVDTAAVAAVHGDVGLRPLR